MKDRQRHTLVITFAVAAIGFAGAFGNVAGAAPPPPAKNCPAFGWSEGLNTYLAPDAAFPTSDTKNIPTPDCNFHRWSWEAFVWATALIRPRLKHGGAALHDIGDAVGPPDDGR